MSDDEKRVRIASPSGERPDAPIKYSFFNDDALGFPPKTLTGADLRNAAIEGAIRHLEGLEGRFKDGDPVRDAIVACRRTIATHLTPGARSGGGGLKVVK
jgi:hypothetical protein